MNHRLLVSDGQTEGKASVTPKSRLPCYNTKTCYNTFAASAELAEMITIRFAGWVSGRIMSLQPDTDIHKLFSNGNRIQIRISETLFSIFRGFRFLEKVAHWKIIYLVSSEASHQPSVPRLEAWRWCNLSTVVQSHAQHAMIVSMSSGVFSFSRP